MCTPLRTGKILINDARVRCAKGDSLISRHEASKMEPTVHGSWPKVFLLYKTAFTKKSWKVQQSPGTF